MVLYYCGFESFLKFRTQKKQNIHLRPLTDLILDNHDKVINAFLGWCSLFLQTGNGQLIYLGYSNERQNRSGNMTDVKICEKCPKYVINIECGSKDTYVLTLDQRLSKWYGQTYAEHEPIPVKFTETDGTDDGTYDVKIDQISVGIEYSAILTDTGVAFLLNSSAGQSPRKQTHIIKKLTHKKITAVSCGQEHVLLLSDTGRVLSYGRGTRGQLGHGDVSNIIDGDAQLIDALDGLEVRSIAAGGWHSMALTSMGDVYVWGWNESGQLGYSRETITMKALPLPLEISEDDHFVSVSAGSRHSMALSENGILFGWGWNKWGQLGLDLNQVTIADSPQVIPVDEKVKSICCKFWSSLIETEREPSPDDDD